MKESINLYLADDHQIVIDGLSLLLKNEKNICIIGSATNGLTAYNDIINLKPNIALIDLRMPEKDGLEIIKSLFNKSSTKFIILSMHMERRLLLDAINYNAYAYLLKNIGQKELLETIYKVANNEKVIIKNPLLKTEKKTFLSPREMDVLKLILVGNTSSQIAEKLYLSQFTIGTHRKNLMKKAGVINLPQLIHWAEENGLS
ncbi:MAG: response regulator transcription factor [Bacteroidota bacterium]|jgi:DNA-binding NarL/FixJ family response regulator